MAKVISGMVTFVVLLCIGVRTAQAQLWHNETPVFCETRTMRLTPPAQTATPDLEEIGGPCVMYYDADRPAVCVWSNSWHTCFLWIHGNDPYGANHYDWSLNKNMPICSSRCVAIDGHFVMMPLIWKEK